MIAVASLLTAVVYVFTPLTAAGQEGSPTGFFTNTRYLVPGLVLAMAMLPLARPIRAPDRRAWQTLLFLTGVFAITVLTTPRWFTGYLVGTVFLTLLPGLGAGGALAGADAGEGQPPGDRRRGRGAGAAGGRPRPRAAGPVRRPALRQPGPVPRRRRAEGSLRTTPRSCTTSGSGSSAPARSSSASTGSTATTPPTTSNTSASKARTAPTGCRPAARSCAA